ncbi:glycosyltransferase [Ferruginibacter sp. HRS2-29]|uniref:glycosyltransferase n=1 Tax=Ferruginibacter sp. HRS2-29 TaxID=2487334 RepID=UPI0020CBC013|nr:glycosyltransferase [Ferruginibacter sp. HRS2-29]MCP9749917.1 glycosyltransferase family 1 protein [Ferruginibacter sp. HRS2-29]
MRTIAFILPHNPYLPELKAYTDYFRARGFNTVNISDLKELDTTEYHIEWHFMGIDTRPRKKNVIKIHDYTSLSIPPFAKIKDSFKKIITRKPDIRVFLNDQVRERMNFRDDVPYGLRDMGVNEIFFEVPADTPKEYDFCYLGNMDKIRRVDEFLLHFREHLKESRILMIGEPPAYLSRMFKNDPDIIFTGKVDYLKIPGLLAKCSYGLNYIPDIYPFNIQTSTKLLEYCACGLKVISNEYEWVRNFEKASAASFYFLDKEFKNFTLAGIRNFNYVNPDMKKHEWEKVIDNSRVLEMINSLTS